MSENIEKTANKTYWWHFNYEHARHLRHFKPIYWGLFSVGGSIALPFGWLGSPAEFYQSIHGFVANKFVYLVLTGIIFSMMWHGVHRFYYLLHDLHYHIGNRFRNICYLVTIAVFLLTLYAGWF